MLEAFGRDADEPLFGSDLGRLLTHWTKRVLEWNQRIDLTAARSPDELVDLLLADAAAVASTLEPGAAAQWVDVGSGAGAPGFGIALLAPALSLTLVEPKAKRVAFLRTLAGELDLAGVRVRRGRSDELSPACFDVAISRATLAPPEWLAEGARLARRSVWLLLARAEPPASADSRILNDLRYVWPLTGVERRALEYALDPAPGPGPQAASSF